MANGEDLAGIQGTCVVRKDLPPEFQEIPSFEDAGSSPDAFCRAQNAFSIRRPLAQGHGNRYVLQYPMPEYTTEYLD